MAEEKKFLEETMEQPKNRKLVAKNVVLAFVVFVILLLCVLAWFTSRSDASASGLSLKTSGENGLEVSLDGGQHWDTKWASREVTGWRKSDILAKYDSTNGGSLMQLLSGNGQDLYYTKSVDADGNVEDKDFVKISDDKAGDYCLEFEAYFRSENQCSVALTDQSKVEPFNLTDNMWTQSTPSFSANYIAGAARVAFLEEDMNDPKKLIKTGLWIPNPFYELGSTSGINYKYKKMPDNYGGSVVTTPGGKPTDPTGTGDYYFWTSKVALNKANTNHPEVLSKMFKIPMQKIDDGKYYCQFYTVQPMPERVEQVFSINQNKDEWDTQYDIISKGDYTFTQDVVNADNSRKIDWNLYSGTYNLTNSDGKTYVFHHLDYKDKDLQSTEETSELVRIVLDTKNKVVSLFEPDNYQISISKPEGTGKLKEHEEIVVTKDVTKGMSNTLANRTFNPAGTDSECDLVVAAVHKTDNKYKFKFKNGENGEKYLAVDSNGALTTVSNIDEAGYFHIIFSETKTQDEENNEICEKLLAYISTDSDGNQSIKYVTYNSGTDKFVLSDSYDTGYMIYQKTATDYTNFSFSKNGNQESPYYYFDGTTKAVLVNKEGTKEYETAPENCTDLVQLNTQRPMSDGKTYYVGKMKVRIFAEGFDREAKKPMEKGKIKVNLQFTATTIS